MDPVPDDQPQPTRPDKPGPHPGGDGAESLASALPRDQDRRWREGDRVSVEEYLRRFPELAGHDTVVLDLIRNEFRLRAELSEDPRPEEYAARFPQYRGALAMVFALLTGTTGDLDNGQTTHSHKAVEGGADGDQLPPPPPLQPAAVVPIPSRIGRYHVLSEIDAGGFGTVYRGRDGELGREVAIKVPHPERTSTPEEAAAFLAEAQILARLDHRGIVPVYDFGRMDDGRCFLVSKLVPGGSLSDRMRAGRFTHAEAAGLVAAAGEALHHAHQHGLVHRDVKPANILLAADGAPVVADFGLALREEDYGRGPSAAGTPAYMSPEQARGEGHLVDARSDVYSLGVVLYELLAGRRPYQTRDRGQLRELVKRGDPRPPRQYDDSIPRELDRICLKAMAKRASDRYSIALDLAEDLRQWLAGQSAAPTVTEAPRPLPPLPPPAAPTPADFPTPSPSSRTEDVREPIVPRGLRSFGPEDADFFLELLPGPRGRGGLPESVRFWKALLEEADADRTFRVGLIYGPSGSGKSSLVKAGLLPRLADHVATVYVEATPDETEVAILKGLRKARPDLPAGLELTEALAFLRRRAGTAGGKILIVIDQFEQWLHAHAGEPGEALVGALRQCDGGQVQALLLVRDDFWMGVTRFMRELEIPLLEGKNSGPIDLFTPRHARKVLAAFGRAFGALPAGDPTAEQSRFLDQAVAGLTDGGKVIAVRLALFAEMVKGKPWTPATWHEAGGAEGIGVAFLEETFAAPTAPPHHRLHQRAARAVLARLLPEPGADLKGPMRSRAELLEASGYAAQPAEFDDLLRVLDGELRLVTATEREGAAAAGERCYQLTHDYLVPALREWLTRKRRETRRGRAELCLAERAAAWAARPEGRNLPSWWEWVRVRLFTRRRDWTPPQAAMMRRATLAHVTRAAAVAACLVLLSWGAWEYIDRRDARELRDRLLGAPVSGVPEVVKEMRPHRGRLEPMLREERARAEAEGDRDKLLKVSLALLRWDDGEVEYLRERLLAARADEFAVVRDGLAGYRDRLTPPLWEEVADPARDPDRRFRAACALAAYDENDPRWPALGPAVATRLVAENALVLGHWREALESVGKKHLLPTLASLLRDDRGAPGQRRTAAELFRAFAGGDEGVFAPLVQFATTEQPNVPPDRYAEPLRQRANVAAALVAMDRADRAWPLLEHRPDPTLRSYLIERIPTSGAKLKTLEERLAVETNVSIRRALILAMGSFTDRSQSAERKLLELYENDPDPGVHGAAEWALRQWGRGEQLAAVAGRLATGRVEPNRRWFVNRAEQTFAIVARGQVADEEDRKGRVVEVGHDFAIAVKEVTVREFLALCPDHRFPEKVSQLPDSPVNFVSWNQAVAYCNLLSERDKIDPEQWCYERDPDSKDEGAMRLKPNYLALKGYRLPTGPEWEFACRAGAVTRWSCGDTSDNTLLSSYACYVHNSAIEGKVMRFRVGTLKPNDYGLFDMHGNVSEWCNGPLSTLSHKSEEKPPADIFRAVRGGDYSAYSLRLASSREFPGFTKNGTPDIGFRPVRAIP